MSYTVTATVPTPLYRPKHPVYQHHDSTAPKETAKPYPDGSVGRIISVISKSEIVAKELATILAKVFDDVTVS